MDPRDFNGQFNFTVQSEARGTKWSSPVFSVSEACPWLTSSGKYWKWTEGYMLPIAKNKRTVREECTSGRLFCICVCVYLDYVTKNTVRQWGSQSDDASSTFMEFVLDGSPYKEPSDGKLRPQAMPSRAGLGNKNFWIIFWTFQGQQKMWDTSVKTFLMLGIKASGHQWRMCQFI